MAIDEARLKRAEDATALLSAAFEVINDEPVTAAAARGALGGMIPRMAASAGRAEPSPSHSPRFVGSASTRPTVHAVASAGRKGITAGSVLSSSDQLAELMSETLQGMRFDNTRDGRCQRLVASASWEYPVDRRLGPDPHDNAAKFEAVCGLEAGRYDRATGALVATGGICLPVNVDFSVPVWSTADRPLRDGLPGFQADRGGIRYVTPPDIGVASLQGTASGAGLATGVWSEATDANPAGATKPVWVVSCGSEQLVYVNAITTRVQFGNMLSRFAPEQTAANTQQAMAISAREAELELLTTMYGSSVQVKPQQYLGAARDLLASVDLLKAQYLYSHRIPRTASFTAVFPDWAKDVLRADLAREIAHDNAGPVNVLAISDAQIEEWFSVRGITVIWTVDGLKAGTYGTGGSAITNQFFPTMTAAEVANSGAIHPQWPGQSSSAAFMLAWLLYVEGTFQFLDGGRLDLGVVRDSLLDSTNDYEVFSEVFESVAFRGVEAYQVQSTILPAGGSAGTVATSSYLE